MLSSCKKNMKWSRLVRKSINEIVNAINVGKNFGIKLGVMTLLNKFIFRNDNIFYNFKKNYYTEIRKYLYKKYFIRIKYNQTQPNTTQNTIDYNVPIWVMWWQGENNMPEVVKKCIDSIKKNAGMHNVCLITKENYTKYVRLPQNIITKFNNKRISITHLSDIIRFYLLYPWGGVWMDATIYMMKPLEREIYDYDLYTINHGLSHYLCEGKWTAFFWAGTKRNSFFGWVLDFLLEYWENESWVIDYF